MNTNQPHHDPNELSPAEKRKRPKYIAFTVVIFFVVVLILMLINMPRKAEDLPSKPTPEQIKEVQQ